MNARPQQAALIDELRALLRKIAPDADVGTLALDADVRDALDIDSMDFLNFAVAVGKHFGVSVPQEEARRLTTLAGAAAFVERARIAAR